MARAKAVTSQMTDMGLTSSQLRDTPATDGTMDDQPKSNRTKVKSKKRKRKSAEVDQTLDPDKESARTLLQMAGSGISDRTASYFSNDFAASQQLITESSSIRSPALPNAEEIRAGPLDKRGSQRKPDRYGRRKRSGEAIFDYRSSEERTQKPRYSQLPATPFDQIDRSPSSPYEENLSRSQHALDDILTDDETAVFDKAFGTDIAPSEPNVTHHGIFSFSQQPSEPSNQQGEMFPSYQLPNLVYTSPRAIGNQKKRKRDTPSVMVKAGGKQQPVANEAGNEIPIDPELHSMSALPPSVDLSALENRDGNGRQAKTRKIKPSGSSRPGKHRPINKIQPTNEEQGQYRNTHMQQGDQENSENQVLIGIEDHARRMSPELGTPFMEHIARGGLEYLNDASKAVRTPRQDNHPRQTKYKERQNLINNSANVHNVDEGYQSERSIKDVSEKGGAFSSGEIAKLFTFRDRYCDANNMNYAFFNSLIQTPMRGNAQVTALFNELHEVLPYRPRMSVQKFARRRFHNYSARGTWTVEEDQELRRAVEEKGKQWKVVGEMIDRMPGDCRDRYRNHLLNSEHRNREQWTEEETKNLCRAILECMQLLKDERRRAREEQYGPDSQEYEEGPEQGAEDIKDINWQAVSDRMGEHGGGRSRLQCSFKWSQLKKQDQNNMLNLIREAQGIKTKRSGPTKNPWRQKKALKRVANMRTGDQYALLQSILEANASSEGNIPWRSLGDEALRATWTAAERKSAWLKMKESISESESMDYREVINRLITRISAESNGEPDERWDPRLHGDVSQSKPRKSKKAKGRERVGTSTEPERRKKSRRSKEGREKAKSNEFVVEETDDEEEDRDTNPTCNPLPMAAKANDYAETNNEAALRIADREEGDETARANNIDRDSLFEGSDDEGDHRPQDSGEVIPEWASRIQLLQFA